MNFIWAEKIRNSVNGRHAGSVAMIACLACTLSFLTACGSGVEGSNMKIDESIQKDHSVRQDTASQKENVVDRELTATESGQSTINRDQVVGLRLLAKPDIYSIKQNTVSRLKVLDNDILSTQNVSSLTIVQSSSHGSVNIAANNEIEYRPVANYFGSDQFSYRVVDASGNESVANVALSIECIGACTKMFALSWQQSSSPGVTGYRVYVGRSSRVYNEVFDVGMRVSYIYTAKSVGSYYLAVTAYNSYGMESDLSGEAAISF